MAFYRFHRNYWCGECDQQRLSYLSIYLSIFLYILTSEGDIRRVPVNQVLGVSVCFLCIVSCVGNE